MAVINSKYHIFVKPLKLELKVGALIPFSAFYFKSTVEFYRAKMIKSVSPSKYFWT